MASRELTIQRKMNRLGSRNPKFVICGYAGIAALREFQSNKITPKQRIALEKHHVAGLHEGGTIVVCGNCHDELSLEQSYWPGELKKKDRDRPTFLHAHTKGAFDTLKCLYTDPRFKVFAAKVYKKTIEAMNGGGMIAVGDVQKCAEEAFRCCFLDVESFSNLPNWDV